MKSDSERMRATAVTAVRFMITDHPAPIDEHLRPAMGEFLATIRDDDLHVRRVAIITLNSAAHNKPRLVRPSRIMGGVLGLDVHESFACHTMGCFEKYARRLKSSLGSQEAL